MDHSQDSYLAVESAGIHRIDGMPDDHLATVRELMKTWRKRYPKNLVRSLYYQSHYKYKGISYSIPDSMRDMAKPMIGWCNKSVRALADLSVFEGFDAPEGVAGMVDGIVEDNELDVEVSQAIVSCYTHGCSFITVYADPDDPERILMIPRSADWSAALWDRRRRRVSAALTITDKDGDGRIISFQAWLPGVVYEVERKAGSASWRCEPIPTYLDRPSVVPFVFDAQLNRPFGSSRVSRTLMALTDFGLRTMVRMEATAEFYSAPRIWFLGANRNQFSADTWSSIVSVINGLPSDKNGQKPTMQQLQQASMQPHSEMLRTIALMVSAETDIPVNDLGITMDNPASAEAMAEAERKLSRAADRQNRRFGRALKDAMGLALTYKNVDPKEWEGLRAIWSPTRETSDAARADYYAKIAGVNPNFADSDVGLMKAGLSVEEIKAQREYERDKRAEQAVDQLRAQLRVNASPEEERTDAGTGEGGPAA